MENCYNWDFSFNLLLFRLDSSFTEIQLIHSNYSRKGSEHPMDPLGRSAARLRNLDMHIKAAQDWGDLQAEGADGKIFRDEVHRFFLACSAVTSIGASP